MKAGRAENDLRLVYVEATHSLIPLLEDIRSEDIPEKRKLRKTFESLPLWKREKKSSGHITFKHSISGRRVSWQNHNAGKHNDNRLNAKQLIDLRDDIQEHLNFFCNDIFSYRTRNWKVEPEYPQAVKRYQRWLQNCNQIEHELEG